MELYTESSFTYTWPETVAGDLQKNSCPEDCRELASYPKEAVVVRRCAAIEGDAEWESVDFSGCGLNTAAFRLCEANQVSHACMFLLSVVS